MLKSILVAVTATMLFAGEPATAQDAAAPTVVVSYADLNLAKARDAREFKRRIARAVDQVCARPPVGNADEEERYQDCRLTTLVKLRPAIAQLAVAQRPTQLAAR